MIFIDIALGNQKHRIELEKNSNVEMIAADFARQHNLDIKLQRKL